MLQFGTAQAAGRIEDHRFLTGQGRFVDDLAPKDALHAAFLRAPVAHGVIDALDLDAARAMPGVHLVLDAAGLRADGVILGMQGALVPNADGTRGAAPIRPTLADGVMRHLGEPVVMVVAETLAQARDAIDAIGLDYSDLAPAMSLGGDPQVHPEAPGNRAYDYAMGDPAAVARALKASAHRVAVEVVHNRVFPAPMENRAAYAEWDGTRLHLCFNGQGVWQQKAELARMLQLDPSRVLVSNPDVGGGFGMKAMPHPEYVPLAQAARKLGRAVRWASDRGEAMLSDNGARDLVALAELGFDGSHRITAYRCSVRSNMGAYNSQFAQYIQSFLFSRVLTGIYDIPEAFLSARGFYTHTTPVDAYRGAGRPEAILTIERAMDAAARQMGIDPFDLRRINAIRTYPYAMVNGEIVHDGDFRRVLNRLQAEADVAGYAARHASSAAKGLLRGRGLAAYIEAILGDPTETARVVFRDDGHVELHVGTQSNGQGHETVFTRLLAARTGLAPERIVLVQGNSDIIPRGGGTGGSRSVTLQGSAIHKTVGAMMAAFADFLRAELGAEVAFDDGTFGAAGSNTRLSLTEAANRARAAGREDLLSHAQTIRLEGRSFPNGAHLCEVEVDPETGAVTVERYPVTDDFGTLIAPDLVLGQVHGGIAQGLGQALCENVVFDDQGQLLTGSFMDYAMPRAADLGTAPRFTTESVPTAANPLGMKGCGEAGTVGALGAISNAVADALIPVGETRVDMPFTPSRVWGWLQDARGKGRGAV